MKKKKKLKNGDIKTRPPDKTESVKHQYLRLIAIAHYFPKLCDFYQIIRPDLSLGTDEMRPGCDILNHIKVY